MTNDDIQMAVRGVMALMLIAGLFFALSYMDAERELTQAGMRTECKK